MTKEELIGLVHIPRYYVERHFGWPPDYTRDEYGSEMKSEEVESALVAVFNLALDLAADKVEEESTSHDTGYFVNKQSILNLKIK